ncbi:MAG: chemotaxis-specific protein-glutamate methyltransferase CheB [Gammaproteobacteria bacterium]|nr:chemotaxis-specific protein-glutamate methyltransferase CheB [Gammaproteobacteria bacterium]
MIRVLIVDDSQVITMLLRAMLEKTPDIEVIGIANNGKEAVEMTAKLKPDIITMDVRMPEMNGLEATQIIMDSNPTPILIVSASVNNEDLKIAFNAIECGALAVIEKPPGLEGESYEQVHNSLINHVHALAKIKPRRRIMKRQMKSIHLEDESIIKIKQGVAQNDLVALGASTGGPETLMEIISHLPVNFPVPIVIVQHIGAGFVAGLANWLNSVSRLIVKIAEDGEILLPGVVYIGPGGKHFNVIRKNKKLMVKLSDKPENQLHTHSINELFSSIAETCPGHAIAGLLTGMGDDGAKGLLNLYNKKCHTFIQDEATSTIFGMPDIAKKLGATQNEVAMNDISSHILTHLNTVNDTRKRKRS